MTSANSPEVSVESENTLFLSPVFHSQTDHVCRELLASGTDRPDGVILVATVTSVKRWLDRWNESTDWWPVALGVISTGEFPRSAGVHETLIPAHTNVTVTSVSSPGDFTGLGIEITELLKAWYEEGFDVTLCLDSITVLLQYAETQQVYEFLYVLSRQMASVNVRAHYHMDPSAHDDETVYMIRSLFDSIIEFDRETGELVQPRVER